MDREKRYQIGTKYVVKEDWEPGYETRWFSPGRCPKCLEQATIKYWRAKDGNESWQCRKCRAVGEADLDTNSGCCQEEQAAVFA